MKEYMQNIEFIEWSKQLWKRRQETFRERGLLFGPAATFLFVLCSALIAFYLQTKGASPKADFPNLDSQIPVGKRMVEVEIVNSDFLDSTVGIFSVVNLYTIPLNRKSKAKLVAKKVQLMRSLKNPGQFVALADSDREEAHISQMGPYRATVLNPKLRSGTEFVKPNPRPRGRVQFDME